MATLIIIDMQDKFLEGKYRDLAKRIVHLINLAKINGDNIILIEYGERWVSDKFTQKTIIPIRKAVKDYDKVFRKTKGCDDGSNEVIMCMNENHLDGPIIACGVNTSCCVKETVLGLTNDYDMQVTVVANCCENVYEDYYTAYDVFEMNNRLQVVDIPEDAYELINA